MQQPRKRNEIDPRWQWNLNDIINGTSAFDSLYAETQLAVEEAAARQGRVAEDPRAAIRSFFEISRAIERMFTYARMRLDEDGSNDEAQTLLARTSTRRQSRFLQAKTAAWRTSYRRTTLRSVSSP